MTYPHTQLFPETLYAQDDVAPHVRWLMDERDAGQAKLDGPRMFAATAREVQEITALTYGMITNIDDRIGMVMQTLKACGADSNTVVIFTSDHGDLMGDHGIVLKGPLHYQGLIRVPMIWREPDGGDGHMACRQDLTSSIDLGAAIIHRAGIAAPNGVQGKPLFTSSGEAILTGRDAVLIEENQQRAYLGFDRPVKVRTIVTDTHRMSVFAEGDWSELYDLQADPLEKHNLWHAPQAQTIKWTLMQKLVQLLMEHSDSSPNPKRIA